MGLVVQKFGGTSVAGPERLKAVAQRLVAAHEQGHDVVGVLSAMGQNTHELLSCALAAMAINDLGHDAISLTGSQAGIVTDVSHGRAKILEVRASRIREAL